MKCRFTWRLAVFSVLTLLWMGVIFFFSAQNGDDSSYTSGKLLRIICDLLHYDPPQDVFDVLAFILRKGAHMTEFGILALLWLGTLRSGFRKAAWHYYAALAAASVYAATDEIHQLFVSDRAGRASDWLIDSTGAVVFLLAAWLISKAVQRRAKAKPVRDR